MKKLTFLLFVMVFLSYSCNDDFESDKIFGKYECTKISNYYEFFTPLHEVTTEEIILVLEPTDGDSIIIDGMKVFRDNTLKWTSKPYELGFRSYYYTIKEDSIFVNYNTGGQGGGLFVEIKGRKN